MEKMVIYKNKGEVLKCHFDIDGASLDEVSVRLCLEFSDNKNMFFHGKLSKNGDCVFNIPRLSELENQSGKLAVEAIADSTYFKLMECDVEIKNSLEVKMTRVEGLSRPEPIRETKIHLSAIERETPVVPPEPVVVEEEEPVVTRPSNPYVPLRKPPVFENPLVPPSLDDWFGKKR